MNVPPQNSTPEGSQPDLRGYRPGEHSSSGQSNVPEMGEETSTYRATRKPWSRTSSVVPVGGGGRRSGGGGAGMNGSGGPTRRRGGPPPREPFWKSLFSWQGVLLTFMSLFALGVASFAIAYAMIDIPKLNDEIQRQATTMYYADGESALVNLNSDRLPVEMKDIPPHVKHAFLAAEDKTFYDNPGFSIMGIGRAVMANLTGGNKQGGSTITQQYVKNAYLTQEQTYIRKLKELIISIKLENGDQALSKDEIFEGYLNAIYFGRRSNGIASAAQSYFGKKVGELDVNEAAFLATLINGPSLYDPAVAKGNQARTQKRMNAIVANMVEMKWLPANKAAAAKAWPGKTLKNPNTVNRTSGPTGYVQEHARLEYERIIKELFDNEKKDSVSGQTQAEKIISTGGYRAYTTVDKRMLESTIQAVEQAGFTTKNKRRIALASVKPGDGAILSMYGGPDFASYQVNSAVETAFQGGSTYKAFTLLAALDKGISTHTYFDASGRYFKEMDPRKKSDPNYGKDPTQSGLPRSKWRGTGYFAGHGGITGMQTLELGTAASINPIYVQLNLDLGPKKTQDMAARLGLSKNDGKKGNISEYNNNVLGVDDTSPLQIATAYAAIAAKGQFIKPYIISKVVNREGKVIFDASANRAERDEHQAFSADVAADAAHAMKGVIRDSNGTAFQSVNSRWRTDRDIAGKTGTTDSSRTAWFSGFTPQISTSVVMYQPHPKLLEGKPLDLKKGETALLPMKDKSGNDVSGGAAPARVWAEVMKRLHEGKNKERFPDRVGIGDKDVVTPAPTFSWPWPWPNPNDPNNQGNQGAPNNTQDPNNPANPNRPTVPMPTFPIPSIPGLPPGGGGGTGRPTAPPWWPRPTGGGGGVPGQRPPGSPRPTETAGGTRPRPRPTQSVKPPTGRPTSTAAEESRPFQY